MWWLLFLCIIMNVSAENCMHSTPATRIQNLVIAKFDLILDENVDDSDPRVKSIIYSTQSDKLNRVVVTYTNPNAGMLAARLAQFFTKHDLLVHKLKQEPLVIPSDSKYVQISICTLS